MEELFERITDTTLSGKHGNIFFKTLWESVKNHPEYRVLPTKIKKPNSRKGYYEWLKKKYDIKETPQHIFYIIF